MTTSEEFFLAHFGKKGMKWGQRKSRTPGVSRATDKHARKDAEEFARAQAFYGKGAGTRRKLIKQTVEGKTKHMPGYSTAFHRHLANQNPAHHAEKAVSERTSIDRREKTRQSAGAVARRLTGEQGTRAAFVAGAMGGAAYLNSSRGRQHLSKAASKMSHVQEAFKRQRGAAHIADFIKKST